MGLAASCVWVSAETAAAPTGVRTLPSSSAAVRFVVEVPEPRLSPTREGARSFQLLLDGYENAGRPGHPALPVRVVTVAVPPDGAVRLRVSGREREVREGLVLARAPVLPRGSALSVSEAAAHTEALADDGEPAERGAPAAGVRARLLEVGWMRHQRVARIAVTPADYDPDARRLTLDRRIEVDLQVEENGGAAGVAQAAPAEDRDPFERLYRGTLVNYAQGRAWRRRAAPRSALLDLGRAGAVPLGAATAVPETSVYAGREWVKIAVDSTGFYKVRFNELKNLSLFGGRTDTRLDNLRLFTWPGFPVLPERGYCDSCDYREVAVGFVEETVNGTLDRNQEYLYFFALGPSDWASFYDEAHPDTVFINHPYETRNYYYLTVATEARPVGGVPKRIATASGAVGTPTGSETTPATFAARLHYELDAQYWPDPYPDPFPYQSNLFWEKWFWKTVSRPAAPSFTTTADAPGVDVSQPSRLRMRCWGVSELFFRSREIFDHYLDVTWNGLDFPRREWNDAWAQTYDTTLVGLVRPVNTLALHVPRVIDPRYDAQRVDATALAWFDLFYARRFEPVGNELAFDSSPAGGTLLYDIGPFTLDPIAVGRPRIFDVTDPLAPVEITGASYTADGQGGYRLSFRREEGGRRRYRVIPDERIKPVQSGSVFMAPSSSLGNLRASPPGLPGADFLVIYYDGFQAAAESLRVWREQRLPLHAAPPPYLAAAIPISAIYDQFSGGRTDPGAVRNFLRAAFFNWAKRPAFVTLLGDASYDFKNIAGFAPAGLPGTLLPAYEGGYDPSVRRQYATDDWMLNVDDPVVVIPDFFGARIPAGDAASAMAFVRDKLLAYERSAPFGEWRNRVMLIADDHEQGASADLLGWLHLRQTVALDRAMPAHADRAYVYLHAYPDGPGETKPGAKADILANINGEGVVMWNYIGHGSPFKIADESVFLDSDAGTLVNAAKPNLFVAASCDVGKYHDPSVQSLGERLVMNPGGGCVAVLSATELAFSNQNAELNRILYESLFARDTTAASPSYGHVGVAEALLEAKSGTINSQKYQVMGDAGTRLHFPRQWVELALTDASGNPVDTLRRGETVRIAGRILERPGGSRLPFVGSVALLIEDSAPVDTTFALPTWPSQPYPFRAAPMFRGDVRVTDGTFGGAFVVPLDAVLGERGRLRGYASGTVSGTASGIDGVGSIPFALVGGGSPAGDDQGPRIALSFPGGSTIVRPDAVLRIDLFDEHGILITGHTLQNGIIVTVDGNSNTRTDVTGSFRYAVNSYQSGTATFQLPDLSPGPHSIRVSAADNLASGINAARHRSSASIDFEVRGDPVLTVRRAFLFPNPTRSGGPGSGGQFVIDVPGEPVNVLLHIYTVAGRRIRTLKAFGGQNQVQIPWDGLDADGDRLASGVYLFTVHVNARAEDGSSSPAAQAVGEGRIVVVGR